jgi:hypothetical protein
VDASSKYAQLGKARTSIALFKIESQRFSGDSSLAGHEVLFEQAKIPHSSPSDWHSTLGFL